MKKIKLFVITALLAISTLAAAADKPTILKPTNSQFSVNLPANPSTGFSWFVAGYNVQLITVVKHKYQPTKDNIPGASGVDTWTFKVNPIAFTAPHIIKIKMVYARPWDLKDNSRMQEITVVTTSN